MITVTKGQGKFGALSVGGVNINPTEMGFVDGVTAGTVTASKAVVVGTDKEIDTLALPVSGLKIGAGAGTAVDRTAAQLNLLAQGVAAGYKIARGQLSTASAADTVVTGLATVVSVVANLESDPTDTCSVATCQIGNQAGAPAAGSVYIKTWKPTTGGAAGNPTLIAATDFTKKVNWIAIGT